MWRRAGWVIVASALVGCVPLPVALPPLRAGVGIQAAQKADPPDDVVLAGQLDVGVFPWQLIEEKHTRAVDLGLGYRGTFGEPGRSLVGPYVEGAYFQYPSGLDSWRLGFHGQLQAISQAGPLRVQGAALNLRASAALTTFVGEPVGSCDTSGGCFFGGSLGESSGALFVEVGAGVLGGQFLWQTTFGLELRIPAVLGIALVPIF